MTTDASEFAVGGVLSQGPIGKDKPIAYTSRVLNGSELNYPTIEKELLAIIYCVNHFRPYLYGKKFALVTDHKPLTWLHSVKDPTSRLLRWRLKLAEYEYDISYKAGKANVNADALSRNPTERPAYPIHTEELDILSDPEDEQIQERNDHARILKTPSPQTAEMREEIEPFIARTNMKTRSQTAQDIDGPIPFTEKELRERPVKRYKVKAMIHREPSPTTEPDDDDDDTPLAARLTSHKPRSQTFQIPRRRTVKDPKTLQPQNPIFIENIFDSEQEEEGETDHSNEDESDHNNFDRIIKDQEFPHNRETRSIRNTVLNQRDKLYMRKDNSLYFLTENGEPVDEGAKQFEEKRELPKLQNVHTGDVIFTKKGNKWHIIVICKRTLGERTTPKIFAEAFQKLNRRLKEHNIETIGIAKFNKIDDIDWQETIKLLRNSITGKHIKIIVCHGTVIEPENHQRRNILEEAHCSTVGGHKGITKTYNRIRQRFYWENLKTDVQNFVRNCIQCQLK